MDFFQWLLLWPLWWIVTLYYYWIGRYQYWKCRRVNHPKPKRYYGNMKPFWKGFQSLPELSAEIYRKFSHRSCYGVFQFNLPVLMVRDYTLTKEIILQDANYLCDHGLFASPYVNPFWPRDVQEEGDTYQSLLNDVLETFTDVKLNRLVDIVNSNVDQFVTFFCKTDKNLSIETYTVFRRFTSDILAAIVFGHSCNSLTDTDDDFYYKVCRATNLRSQLVDFFLISSVHPRLPKFFGMHLANKSTARYLRSLIKKTIQRRSEGAQDPPDFLYDLMTAKEKYSEVTDDVLAAAAAEIFMTGFDVISRSLFFLMYELAINQKVQNDLYEEIKRIFEKEESLDIAYETVQKMKYMDMVVSESLRKWPLYTTIDKKVRTPFTLDPMYYNDQQIHLEGEVYCSIPVFAIHHDPEVYPNPESFKPERFKNRTDRTPNYFPFAAGRKKRFGNRFALLVIKTVALYFLKKFKIKGDVDKTRVSMVLCRESVNPQPTGQLWLQLKRRDRFP